MCGVVIFLIILILSLLIPASYMMGIVRGVSIESSANPVEKLSRFYTDPVPISLTGVFH